MGPARMRTGSRILLIATAIAAMVLLSGVAASAQPANSSGVVSLVQKPACQVADHLPTPICHVFVVFMENQEEYQVVNSTFQGKYLIPHYASAAQYYSV